MYTDIYNKIKYKLVIKDYNSLYTIYLIKFCKVLVRIIYKIIIVLISISIRSYSVLLALLLKSSTPLY